MKLSFDGDSWTWKYEVAPLDKRDKGYLVRIGVSLSRFFFDLHPKPHEWHYIAEIVSFDGVGLCWWQTNEERKCFFDELLEKLKENNSKGEKIK
jgi:hypothetical protein